MSTEPDGSPIRKPHDMMHQHLLGGESEPPRRASDGDGTVRSTPRVVLRIEGAVILGLAVFGYVRYGGFLWGFFLLLFVSGICAIGYVAGAPVWAFSYWFRISAQSDMPQGLGLARSRTTRRTHTSAQRSSS